MINPQKIERTILISICTLYVIFSLVIGCSKRRDAPPPKTDPDDVLEGISHQIKAYIYLDCTGSMEGFVCPSPTTNYVQTLQVLESAVNTGWKTPQIHFFKFGAKIKPLASREHLKAVKREFYQNSEIALLTHIDKVINNPNTCSKDSLTVIVTDLFQNDADVSLLTDALNKKCIQANYAVGVLGIRSQYDGTVCEIGVESDSFPYRSNDTDLKTFRPFYLLILGRHADVANYFEQLRPKLPFISKDTFVILSRHIVNPLASFEGAFIDEIQGLAEVTNILSSNLQDSRVKQFIVRKDANVGFTVTLKYNLLSYTIPFNSKQLEAKVIAALYDPAGKFQESKEAAQSFNIEKISYLTNAFRLKGNLTPTTLPGNGIYRYEIIVHPSKDAYNVVHWWSDWDMDLSKIERWRRNPKTFDGSKTLNLRLFMDNLWQKNFLVHQPKIARIYFYFEK